MSEIDVLLHDVNKNREDGKVLFATIDGVMSANLAEFITQPADGILYDLNRDEVTTASFGITTRTINDLAVATVIRYLCAELARRDEYISKLEAKIPKLNIDLAEASTHAYNGESARMKLEAELARRDEELKITDGLLKEATETIGAVVACCTYNSNDDAMIGIYGVDQKAFTRIDQFITHYNDAVSAGKVSVDVKTSTDNNKRSKWKAYVPGWDAPTVNKRYLVKLINDWITIATYYLRVGGGYWKDDRGQELADGVVSLWKGLEE